MSEWMNGSLKSIQRFLLLTIETFSCSKRNNFLQMHFIHENRKSYDLTTLSVISLFFKHSRKQRYVFLFYSVFFFFSSLLFPQNIFKLWFYKLFMSEKKKMDAICKYSDFKNGEDVLWLLWNENTKRIHMKEIIKTK